MSNEGKRVTFKEESKLNKNSNEMVSILKVEYIWQHDKDSFKSRNKIIKTLNKNIKVPTISTIYNDREFFLIPKFITLNPFKNDDSLLAVCDVLNIKSEELTFEKRSLLTKTIESNKLLIESQPKISFKIKLKLMLFDNELDKRNTLNSIINLCLKARININEYHLESDIFILENEQNVPITCAEEFIVLKYILDNSKLLFNFDFEILENKIYFKFLDKNTIADKGIEKLKEYQNLYKLKTNISESVEKLGKGYLVGEFTYNRCIFESINEYLLEIYKTKS